MATSENDDTLPTDPDFWKKLIADIENDSRQYIKEKILKDYDYVNLLPEDLYKKVAEFVSMPADESEVISEDDLEEGEEEQEEFAKAKRKKEQDFNESTCSEVEHLEKEYQVFDLKLAEQARDGRKQAEETENWIKEYISKKRRDRVKWESKTYRMERTLNEMNLEEQAEELMDASAEKFCNWLNNLGRGGTSSVSKDKLKALFSIEGEKSLFSSIMIDPTIVHAISKAVAEKWNMPHMALELKFDDYLRNRLKTVPKKIVKVAFGRTVAEADRPWTPSKDDKPITTVFPEELLSMEALFKGIRHLRTTKALVEFLEKHPKFDKPRYLVKSGMFVQKKGYSSKKDQPLYERLKLRY